MIKALILVIIAGVLNTQPATDTRICEVAGTFTNTFEDIYGETYYQFKSYDDEVWWCGTDVDFDGVPELGVEYKLTYWNNGTTADNKPCDCPAEYDCECELYDDVLLGVERAE